MSFNVFFRSRLTLSLAVTAMAAGAVVLQAQGGGGQQPQGGGAALVVDFIATTADGQPVTELLPTDVTIRVSGRQRQIQSLTLKRVAGGSAAPAAAPAAPSAPASNVTPPFFTNEATAGGGSAAGGSGRNVLIIVDTESLRAGAEAEIRPAIERLLAGMTPADRVAFSIAPRDTAQVPLAPVGERIRTAVAALRGQRPANVNSGDSICRTKDVLSFLRSAMVPFAGSPDPTTVIFISATLSLAGTASGSAGTCAVSSDDYRTLGPVAAAARANVYVVQGDPGTLGRDQGLENLAGITGAGTVMRVTDEALASRILSDSGAYWVATLAPDPSDRPGPPQRLEVRSAKEGVAIHARSELAMTFRPAAGAGAPAPGGKPLSARDMIGRDQPFTDLQLRATAIVQRGAQDKMTVLVFAEPTDPTVKLTAMRVGFFDQTNRGSSIDAPQIATYPIAVALPLAVGEYRIRVAATDASGKGGAVDFRLNTALATSGPFKISSLLVGAPDASGSMKPRMVFSDEEKVLAMFEIYGPAVGANLKVGFEIATSDDAKPLQTVRPAGIVQANEPDKFQIFGEIPIAKLEPGDYVLRAYVGTEDGAEGRVVRTIRKVAK